MIVVSGDAISSALWSAGTAAIAFVAAAAAAATGSITITSPGVSAFSRSMLVLPSRFHPPGESIG
jgi:hypothetical protein